MFTSKRSEYAKIQIFNIFRTVARQVTVNGHDFDEPSVQESTPSPSR
jgi:hypothetical protein